MLSLRPNYLAFFFCLFLALSPANAIPVVIERQSDGQSTTLQTQSTTSTPVGDMTQTCVITLTPITVNGQQEFQEVKTCTLSMAAQNNSGGNANGGNTNGGGSTNGGDTSSSTDTGDSSTSTDSSNSGSTSTDTSGTAAPTDAGGSPVSVDGLSTVSPSSVTASATDSTGASASATDSASTSTSATAAPDSAPSGAPALSAGSIVMVPASSQNTAITSATQAADQAPSSSASAAFVVPGQKIQVLPIGLGVFAGISVIALIVVGLVTYERTKYRKAFRARKLAESGAGMGYGGMAQR